MRFGITCAFSSSFLLCDPVPLVCVLSKHDFIFYSLFLVLFSFPTTSFPVWFLPSCHVYFTYCFYNISYHPISWFWHGVFLCLWVLGFLFVLGFVGYFGTGWSPSPSHWCGYSGSTEHYLLHHHLTPLSPFLCYIPLPQNCGLQLQFCKKTHKNHQMLLRSGVFRGFIRVLCAFLVMRFIHTIVTDLLLPYPWVSDFTGAHTDTH